MNDLVKSDGGNLPAPAGGNAFDWSASLPDGTRVSPADDAERDNKDMQSLVDELAGQMGDANFKAAVEHVHSFLTDELGDQLADDLLHARLDDGMLVGNHPDLVLALMHLSAIGLSLQQMAQALAAGGGNRGGGGGDV